MYVSTSIHDAYAAIRDPKYDLGDCSGSKGDTKGQTCCWYKKSYPGHLVGEIKFARHARVIMTQMVKHMKNVQMQRNRQSK